MKKTRPVITVMTPITIQRLRALLKDFVVIIKSKNGNIQGSVSEYLVFFSVSVTLAYLFWS